MTSSIILFSIAILCSIQIRSEGTEYGQNTQQMLQNTEQGNARSTNFQQNKMNGSIRSVSLINRIYRKQKREVTEQKTRRSEIAVPKLRRLDGKQKKGVTKQKTRRSKITVAKLRSLNERKPLHKLPISNLHRKEQKKKTNISMSKTKTPRKKVSIQRRKLIDTKGIKGKKKILKKYKYLKKNNKIKNQKEKGRRRRRKIIELQNKNQRKKIKTFPKRRKNIKQYQKKSSYTNKKVFGMTTVKQKHRTKS